MIVEFTMYEPVLRIATADLELTDDDVQAIKDGYGLTATGIESYILEHMDTWEDHASVEYEFLPTSDGIVYEVFFDKKYREEGYANG